MRSKTFHLVVAGLLAANLASKAEAQDFEFAPEEFLDQAQEWAKENLDENILAALNQVDRDRVKQVLTEIESRFEAPSVYDLAPLKSTALTLLPILKQFEETAPLGEWLETRLDYMEVAEELKKVALKTPPKPPETTLRAPTVQAEKEVWVTELVTRPMPANAKEYVTKLKPIFVAEKVPAELIWLAEIESNFNPKARSPVGAEGMFQLMKPTAQRFGLSTLLPDERHNPEKSARAAASYLRFLHNKFGDWRLALAAYNAGEGRVEGLLKRKKSRKYEDIAPLLPSETQMYVPKYEATLKKREGLTLAQIKIPR